MPWLRCTATCCIGVAAKALAEDLTSETILGALHSIRRGYADEVTVAWLIGIARHKLADHWRREEREQRHLVAVAVERAGPDREVEVEPELGMEVLTLLSPSHRAALVLRHVDGLSVPEVATLLGRSVPRPRRSLCVREGRSEPGTSKLRRRTDER